MQKCGNWIESKKECCVEGLQCESDGRPVLDSNQDINNKCKRYNADGDRTLALM